MLVGVDTDTVNWPAFDIGDAKADGVDFAITKVSQGTYFDYPEAKQRIRATQDAGLVAGAYHFLTRIVQDDGVGEGRLDQRRQAMRLLRQPAAWPVSRGAALCGRCGRQPQRPDRPRSGRP